MRIRLLCMMLALALTASVTACSTSPDTTRDDDRADTEAAADRPQQAERYDEMRGDDNERDAEERQTEGTEGETPTGGGPMGDMDREEMERHCPMQLEDVEVDIEEVDQGIAMLFSTEADVVELRERVQWMSDRHNEMLERSNDDRMHGRMHRGSEDDERGHGMMRGEGMAPMPEAHARVEQTEDGARLVLIARDDDNVEALRDHVDERVDAMQERGCPMMYEKMDDEREE